MTFTQVLLPGALPPRQPLDDLPLPERGNNSMTTIRCSFTPQPEHQSGDIMRILSDVPTGVLTDEHAQSSYGVPVLVDETGRVYGSGDLTPGSALAVMVDDGHAVPDLLWRAVGAGYRIRILRPNEPLSHDGTWLP